MLTHCSFPDVLCSCRWLHRLHSRQLPPAHQRKQPAASLCQMACPAPALKLRLPFHQLQPLLLANPTANLRHRQLLPAPAQLRRQPAVGQLTRSQQQLPRRCGGVYCPQPSKAHSRHNRARPIASGQPLGAAARSRAELAPKLHPARG